MFNVLNKNELMDVNGGMFAVPYYTCSENFKAGKSSGYTWTSDPRCAYCIWTYYYDRNGKCLYWYVPGGTY